MKNFNPKREAGEPKTILSYVPHGVEETTFRPLTSEELGDFRSKVFNGEDVEFAVLYNNRNIARKQLNSVILAFRDFFRAIGKEKGDKCRLVLKTQPVDENGIDAFATLRDLAPELKVVMAPGTLSPEDLNKLYNCCDVVINLASAEGFGIGTLEGLMAGKMIIANVTGGLQDQMGFKDEQGNYLDPEIHFSQDFGSNHKGRYKEHGEWAVSIFPQNITPIGSPPTPYIFDDRVSFEDAAIAIQKVYEMPPEERTRRGLLGREYAIEMGMTASKMGERMIKSIDCVLEQFTPRKRFGLYKSPKI